jgi:protein TonB
LIFIEKIFPVQVPEISRPPQATYDPEPDYSEQARKAGLQGTCTLSLTVTKEGLPADIKIIRSLGIGLDEKAVEAVKTWRFDPALHDGKAIPVKVETDLTFRLY